MEMWLRILSVLILLLTACVHDHDPQAYDQVHAVTGWTLFWKNDSLHGIPASSSVPWKRLRNRALPDTGYATYTTVLHVDTSKYKTIAFSIKEMNSAYSFFVNGQLLFSNGVVGHSYAEEVPQSLYRQGSVRITSPELPLRLEVSNYHNIRGGFSSPMLVGSPQGITFRHRVQVGLLGMALGILALFFIQHLAVFIHNPREFPSLFFALYSLAWFVLIAWNGGELRLITLLFPGIPYETLLHVGLIAFVLVPPITGRFCLSIFPYRLQEYTNRITIATALLLVLTSFFVPLRMALQLSMFYAILVLLFMVPLFMNLFSALRQKKPGALTYLIGYMFFGLLTALNILGGMFDLSLIPTAAYGAVSLAFAQALILSQRTARIAHANERLLERLTAQNMELEQALRVKDEFLANTTHELRTPLHGILGIVESIQKQPGRLERNFVLGNLELVSASARRLASLVNDILDVARIRHGDLQLHLQPMRLADLLDTQWRSMEPLAQRKNIGLKCEIANDLPYANIDADRFAQILVNLLGNAIKFTQQGEVSLRAYTVDGNITIAVSDTGCGIAPAAQERIFEPFFQIKSDIPYQQSGAGLGLTITRKLVELHGGSIRLESKIGEGSTFVIEIPAYQGVLPQGKPDESRPSPYVAPVLASIPESSGRNSAQAVLAIDDEPINLQVIRNHLESQGYSVVCAESGLRVLALIEQYQPKVVLLDIMMPERNGFEVCAEIRSRHKDLPVIFVTARNRMDDVLRGFSMGAEDYVTKPFLRDELLRRVAMALRTDPEEPKEVHAAQLAVQVMQCAIALWTELTQSTKEEFAEKSGLWSVQADVNGWRRTQTLDKYLDAATVPRQPRWIKVKKTAQYVLDLAQKARSDLPKARELKERMQALEQITASANREISKN